MFKPSIKKFTMQIKIGIFRRVFGDSIRCLNYNCFQTNTETTECACVSYFYTTTQAIQWKFTMILGLSAFIYTTKMVSLGNKICTMWQKSKLIIIVVNNYNVIMIWGRQENKRTLFFCIIMFNNAKFLHVGNLGPTADSWCTVFCKTTDCNILDLPCTYFMQPISNMMAANYFL